MARRSLKQRLAVQRKQRKRRSHYIDVSNKAYIEFKKADDIVCPIYLYDIKECSYNEPVERLLNRSAYTIFKEKLLANKR